MAAQTATAGDPTPDHRDLDTRIGSVELRLIAREQDLRRRWAELLHDTREAVQPGRLLAPAAGGALSLLALWGVLRGSHAAAPGMAAKAAEAANKWLRLLPMAWPMLPAQWRSRVSPATASTVLSVALPLLQRALGGAPTKPLDTVARVDLGRISGIWWRIAHLPSSFEPAGAGVTRLCIAQRDDGKLDLAQRSVLKRGARRASQVVADPVAGSAGARWNLTRQRKTLRWLPGATQHQAVLHLDEGYTEALLGSPDRSELWLLSRSPDLARERRLAMVHMARDEGFAVKRLRFADGNDD